MFRPLFMAVAFLAVIGLAAGVQAVPGKAGAEVEKPVTILPIGEPVKEAPKVDEPKIDEPDPDVDEPKIDKDLEDPAKLMKKREALMKKCEGLMLKDPAQLDAKDMMLLEKCQMFEPTPITPVVPEPVVEPVIMPVGAEFDDDKPFLRDRPRFVGDRFGDDRFIDRRGLLLRERPFFIDDDELFLRDRLLRDRFLGRDFDFGEREDD